MSGRPAHLWMLIGEHADNHYVIETIANKAEQLFAPIFMCVSL